MRSLPAIRCSTTFGILELVGSLLGNVSILDKHDKENIICPRTLPVIFQINSFDWAGVPGVGNKDKDDMTTSNNLTPGIHVHEWKIMHHPIISPLVCSRPTSIKQILKFFLKLL